MPLAYYDLPLLTSLLCCFFSVVYFFLWVLFLIDWWAFVIGTIISRCAFAAYLILTCDVHFKLQCYFDSNTGY